MDIGDLKEQICRAVDGLGGTEVARAAACIVLGELTPAPEKNWNWVLGVLDSFPQARLAILEMQQHIKALDRQRRAPALEMFKNWLSRNAPYLSNLWDWEAETLDQCRVESYLANASHGQTIMFRFVAGVWLGENSYHFDMHDAACALDDEQKAAITEWFKSPFWP